MVTRTFIEKCTTIIDGTEDNFGFNPIAMLNYGRMKSRCLLWFPMDKILPMKDSEEISHTLKLTNCGSIDQRTFDEMVISSDSRSAKERATSFTIIAFRIPERWDAGRGFDNSTDYWFIGKNSSSKHGANWYQAVDGKPWGDEVNDDGDLVVREGVYSDEFLSEECEKFMQGDDSVIVAMQHFDTGNENFSIDITGYVNDVLDGKFENNGLCLAFHPDIENALKEYTQYIGFFTNHTNTFFHPVLESRSKTSVLDNRYSFYNGKRNRLYFYANLGGVLVDLDETPICEIDGVIYPVKRQSAGVYYAEVLINGRNKQICYDIWKNLKYNGENIDDVEMEFVILPKQDFFKLGESKSNIVEVEPSISGINDNEKIYQGDERTLTVKFRVPYGSEYELMNEAYYRLYVKDGKREYDVIDWDSINVEGFDNTFKIKSGELLPREYHVDIKAKCGNDSRIFKNKLSFRVVDNITNAKR